MSKTLMRFCSMLLAFVMLLNMMPLNIMASELQEKSASEEAYGATADESEILAEEADSAEDAYIVAEIEENRTESSKEYVLSNGLHMFTMYAEPVHYEEDGQWEEIDNTLTISDGYYENTAGIWDVSLPEELDSDNAVSVTKDGYTLSFYMTGELRFAANNALATAAEDDTAEDGAVEDSTVEDGSAEENATEMYSVHEPQLSAASLEEIDLSEVREESAYPETISEKAHSRLEYEDVYGDTDIRYDLKSHQLKESIIIEAYDPALLGYAYTLDVGNLQPELSEDGEILLYDQNKENVIMVMPAPYMFDEAGDYNYDINVTLQNNEDGTYKLSYILPREWLADENRQWPVVLDPVIRAESTVTNVSDQTVYSKTSISYTDGVLQVGYRSGYGIGRAYLKYNDLPELTSADVITAAYISLYKPYNSSNTCSVEVHKVLKTWNSKTITWSNKPGYDSEIEDYVICHDDGTYTWDITDIAREWYTGENTGLMFKVNDDSETSGNETWKQFLSSDFADGTVPVMAIVFRNNNGLEGYWDYTASGTTRAGSGYVNNYTGNLTWIHEDMGFGGTRTSVTINHVYNANDSAKNTFGLGYGWRTNYNQRVYKWSENSKYYVWEDADGTAHYFEYSSDDKVYKDEDGLELTLTASGSGSNKYCIKDKDGNRSYFDENGRLSKISNNQKTTSNITITYTTSSSKKIDTITDGVGRVYYFTYNEDGLLSQLYYKGTNENLVLRSMDFEYTSKKLSKITYQDGEFSKFGYSTTNNNRLLTKVTDIDDYNLNYTYTEHSAGQPARIASIVEKDDAVVGGSLSMEYGLNQTTFTDQSGNVQMMQFNNWGNTISIQDDQGNAQYSKFASDDPDDGGKGNQLALSSALQNTVGNIMKSGDFDYDMTWYVSSDNIAFEIVSGTAYSGNKALKATTTTDAVKPNVYSPSYSIAPGTSVTFSAYVKTGDAPAYLAITGGRETVRSEELAANSDWTRLQISYTNNSSAEESVRCRLAVIGHGVTYMDCVQFEKAAAASRFNLVANGDFRYTGCWNSTNRITLDGDNEVPAPARELNNVAHKVTGSPTAKKRISQTIDVSGKKGDCYVLAGWAKAASVPLDAADDHSSNTREFGIIATFNNTDGTTTKATVHFNNCVEDWQYAAEAIVAKAAYDSITIEVAYDYNANTAYFDGIQLFKERYGQSYTYDEDGNVVSVVDLQGQKTKYEYTENDLTKEILPTGAELTYTYDDYHNVLTATTQTGVKYEFTYDTYGNNTSVSIVDGSTKITTSATYTADGNRIATTTDAAGNVTTYNYAKNANTLQWVQYPEDTEETRTNYTYDDMHRLMTSVTASTDTGKTLTANYAYADDLLTKITTGSTVYNFAYGNFGQTSSIKVGSQTLASYSYTDKTNYLQALAYGNGDRVEYTYDQQGRVTLETYEDGATVQYLYDNDGELAAVVDSETGITSYMTSDFTDRNVQYREVGTGYEASLTYSYNKNNLVTKIVENIDANKRNTVISYDEDNRVATWRKAYSRVNYTYDDFGRVSDTRTEHTYGDGKDILSEHYEFVSPGSGLTSTQVKKYTTTGAGNYSAAYEYTYDDNGNILSVKNGSMTTSYVYDSANQLVRENNPETNTTTAWTYDNAGNILIRQEYTFTLVDDLSTVIPTTTISYGYSDSNWGDLLTEYDGQTITYDQIGNPLTDGTWTYSWKHGRELASMTDGSTTWNYTYNADGLRTKRTNGEDTYDYVYLDGQLVKLTVNDSGNEIVMYFAYDADGTPLSVNYQGTTYYYATNLQGDVVAIVNQSGNKLVSYTYDAWGKPYPSEGSGANTLGKYNPLRYRGYVYDTETGLYYLRSRYYDPEMGRFINEDGYTSTGQGVVGNNMFTYCGNNPVTNHDPGGNKYVALCPASPSYQKATTPNMDITETLEEAALSEMRESGMSFYKGAPLTQVNDGRSAFTFGYIFMGANGDENLLKHEYGHIVQSRELGMLDYGTFIVYPSVVGYCIDQLGLLPNGLYFSLPWEYKADEYGGASHNYKPWAKAASDAYWTYVKFMSLLTA